MEDKEFEFLAYSKLLLRSLVKIKESIVDGDNETALSILNDLIEDTEGDIS